MSKDKTVKEAQNKPDGYTLLGNVDFEGRIKDKPMSDSWYNGVIGAWDGFKDEGKVDYNGLNDHEKIALYVYAWNKSDIFPSKRGASKYFGWSKYKVAKLVKELGGLIEAKPTFSQHTGLISGRGYCINVA